MSNSERMKTVMERDIKAIKLRPAVGRGKETMTVSAKDDGVCHVADGEDTLTVDLGEAHGGKGTTPGPGFLVRAALGACLTQGYYIWAAYLGVPIHRINVEIRTEYDVSGSVGLDDDVTCGYTVVGMVVEVDSPAPRAEIERVIDTTEHRSFMRAIFAEEHKVERELRIASSVAA